MPSIDVNNTLFGRGLLKLVRFVMVVCSIACTGCIVYSVVLRYIFKANFYGSDEIILMFAFWLYFIGAVHGSYEDSHIKADLLNVYVKNLRGKDLLNLSAQLVTIVVNVILLFWSWDFFRWGMEKMPRSTALKIPLVIPQSVIFFGLLLMLFYHVVYCCRNIQLIVTQGYFSEPQEGDYISDKLKSRFPQAGAPLKSEIAAAKLGNNDMEGGES